MIQQEQTITYHTVTLGPLTREGHTLAEITEQDDSGEQHTRTLHVPAGLPGEVVTIAVEASVKPPKRHRRRWKPRPPRVEITEIHQPSPLRTQAPCPVFGICGGCQLQHMHYAAQLEWKRSVVHQLLQDIGNFNDLPLLETVPCDNPWHYRNHMRFSVNRDGQPGLTARGTHHVLPLTACPIAHEQINRALFVLSQLPNQRPQVLIRCGAATHQMLIQPHPAPAVSRQLTDAGLDLRTDTMQETLAGETFRIRPSSFFQTNTAQAEKMAQMVLNGLLDGKSLNLTSTYPTVRRGEGGGDGLGGPLWQEVWGTSSPAGEERGLTQVGPLEDLSRNVEAGVAEGGGGAPCGCLPSPPLDGPLPLTIADAYCGVGTFALLLARHVNKVIAIEESASAIKDAQWNLREVSNVDIVKAKVEDVLPDLASQLDGLVIDPPRAGCQQVVLDALVQHPVARLVYVSCDPSTLARDLNILCHLHPIYRLRSVQPLDMFPQTAHIECVAVLERHI